MLENSFGLLVVLTERIVLLTFTLTASTASKPGRGTMRMLAVKSWMLPRLKRTGRIVASWHTWWQLPRPLRSLPSSCTPISRRSPTACLTSTFGTFWPSGVDARVPMSLTTVGGAWEGWARW